MNIKLTIKEIEEEAKKKGYEVLSTEYFGILAKIHFKCSKGHEKYMSWSNFRQGHECRLCQKEREQGYLFLNIIKPFFKKEGYHLLPNNKYQNIYTHLHYMCPKGHKGRVCWSLFKQGRSRCKICQKENEKISINEVRTLLAKMGYKLLSTQYTNCFTNFEYECSQGHRGQKNWNCLRRGLRCPKCCGRDKTIDEIKDIFEKRKYTLLSKDYQYSHSKLDYICPKGHKGQISWDSFKQGHGCGKCKYKGETRLGEILEQLFPGKVQYQDNLEFLDSQKVDYSIRDLCLAFEYDGEQHYRPTRFIGVGIRQAKKNFQVQQKRDERKNRLCKENGYHLIRIPYYIVIDEDKIKNKILELGVRHVSL